MKNLTHPQMMARAVGIAVQIMLSKNINPFMSSPYDALEHVKHCRGRVISKWAKCARPVECRMFFSMWRNWQQNKGMEYRQKARVTCGK